MLNPIRERKLSHLFHILDRNHDGVLSRQDFE